MIHEKVPNSWPSNLPASIETFKPAYTDVGQGKVPILFLHGFPFDRSTWQKQLDFLQVLQRSIAIDIRGFGETSGGNATPSIALFADDLINFMDAHKIEKAIVCGLSMGGYIVLNAIDRYPERFEAIILSDTQCVADTAEQKENRQNAIADVLKNGSENFAETFLEKVFSEKVFMQQPELVEEVKNIILNTHQDSIASGLKAIAIRADMCTSLERIEVPALIICGSEDQITPPAQAEAMHRAIKNSELRTIKGAGHLSNQEKPIEFNRHVLRFIQKITGEKKVFDAK